jgi:UDP-N-acetylmuramoyl-tripeptide--D-alanyl-D-alanine ligase
MLTTDDVLKATGGSVLQGGDAVWSGVGTDSRAALRGQLFVALRGANFDAHDFLDQAVAQGAGGLLIDRAPLRPLPTSLTLIKVADTLLALQALARFWRHKMPARIVALTGSNGKTTTKEFLAHILGQRYRVHFSPGSYNNHWGVPISLLGLRSDHDIAVVEMGMNHRHEIEKLCSIAEPDVVGVTMVGRAHIGELGSQANIALAKREIYDFSPRARRVFNLDNEWTLAMFDGEKKTRPAERVWTFATFREDADVQMRISRMSFRDIQVEGRIDGVSGQASIPVYGRHNLTNVMAAAALALACGMDASDIWRSLSGLKGSWGRNQLVQLNDGSELVFDGYNANPDSVTALLKNFFETDVAGKKVVILGEMLELGTERAASHREIGEMVGRSMFDVVWFLGPSCADFAAGVESTQFSKKLFVSEGYEEKVARQIAAMLKPGDVTVVKGSRGAKLEQVVLALNPKNFQPK